MKLMNKEIIAVTAIFILWILFSLGSIAELMIFTMLGLIYMNTSQSVQKTQEESDE